MIQKGKSYVYGTAAEKLEYDVYEENKVLKTKKIHRSNGKAKAKLVFSILFVFVLCFTLMYRYALITELNYKLVKTYKSYNEIRNENSRLKVDLEKSTDLRNVREVAEQKLGMQKPDKFQIVYVNVPKNDFTIVADEFKDEKIVKGGMFVAILNKFESFTHLLN